MSKAYLAGQIAGRAARGGLTQTGPISLTNAVRKSLELPST
jgi:hypothetical protein